MDNVTARRRSRCVTLRTIGNLGSPHRGVQWRAGTVIMAVGRCTGFICGPLRLVRSGPITKVIGVVYIYVNIAIAMLDRIG